MEPAPVYQLVETRVYPHDDPEFNSDVSEVVLRVDGREVLRGDDYHHKIDDQIAGFLAAFNFFGYTYKHEVVYENEDAPIYEEGEDEY